MQPVILAAAIVFVFLWNIGNARFDAWRIDRNIRRKRFKSIKHGYTAAAYAALLTITAYFTGEPWLILYGLLLRLPVFNVSLNYFRRRDLDYVDEDPDAITDDILFSLFGHEQHIVWIISFIAAWLSLTLFDWSRLPGFLF